MERSSQNGGILSRLALHFPLIFSFWGRHNEQQVVTGKQTEVFPPQMMSSDDVGERTNQIASDGIDSNLDKNCEELEPALSNNSKLPASRFSLTSSPVPRTFFSKFFLFHIFSFSLLNYNRDSGKTEDLFDTNSNYNTLYDSITEGGNLETEFNYCVS